jgi:hypothetical protein
MYMIWLTELPLRSIHCCSKRIRTWKWIHGSLIKLIAARLDCKSDIPASSNFSPVTFSIEELLCTNHQRTYYGARALSGTGSRWLFRRAARLVFPLLLTCRRVSQWSRPSRHGTLLVRKYGAKRRWIWGFKCRFHVIWTTQRISDCSILMWWRELFALALRICMRY